MTEELNIRHMKGFMRLPEILELIPIGKSTWWAGVKKGVYPSPYKLGPKTTVWIAAEIYAFIEKIKQKALG